jgi:ATP synthase protein I
MSVNNNKKKNNEFTRALAMLSQVAISIIACLAVGIFLGWLLDYLLGTTPWLMFVCTFLGVGAAFKSIFDFAKKVK